MIRHLASALASVLPEPLFARLYHWRDTTHLGNLVVTPFAKLLRTDDVRVARGPGTGLRISGVGENASYALGIAEPEVQAMMQDHLATGGTFYDVGANVGFFTLLGARLVGSSGQVIAFEPVAETAAALRTNVERNGFKHVRVQQVAASDAAGTIEMVVGGVSQVAHIIGMRGEGEPEGAHTQSVQTTAIDGLVASGVIPPPTFIKMDIEGAECLALAGLRTTLETHRPVVLCEIHDTMDEVCSMLEEARYSCHAIDGRSVSGKVLNSHVLALPA